MSLEGGYGEAPEIPQDVMAKFKAIKAAYKEKGKDFFVAKMDGGPHGQYFRDNPAERDAVLASLDSLLSDEEPTFESMERDAKVMAAGNLEQFYTDVQIAGESAGKVASEVWRALEKL